MSVEHYTDYQLRIWSIEVRRAAGPCQLCGNWDKRQAHHIFDKSTYPELALVFENGICLCSTGNNCHGTFHNWWMKGTQHSCTAEDWRDFIAFIEWNRNMIARQINKQKHNTSQLKSYRALRENIMTLGNTL